GRGRRQRGGRCGAGHRQVVCGGRPCLLGGALPGGGCTVAACRSATGRGRRRRRSGGRVTVVGGRVRGRRDGRYREARHTRWLGNEGLRGRRCGGVTDRQHGS